MDERGAAPDTWWPYIQNELDARGWTGADFQRASGLSRTRVTEWRHGKGVTVDGARAVAKAFGQPLLTVLVAAGIITAEEAKLRAAAAPSPTQLTDDQLVGELMRRVKEGRDEQAITQGQIETDPGRFIPVGVPAEPPSATRRARTVHGGRD